MKLLLLGGSWQKQKQAEKARKDQSETLGKKDMKRVNILTSGLPVGRGSEKGPEGRSETAVKRS